LGAAVTQQRIKDQKSSITTPCCSTPWVEVNGVFSCSGCAHILVSPDSLKQQISLDWIHPYVDQKVAARGRGINFLLTYEEWLKIWQDSGHLHERGRGIGQYCMSRKNDIGPYSKDNVDIILGSQNAIQAPIGKRAGPKSAEVRLKISNKLKGRKHTDERRKNQSLSHMGLKQSQETIQKRMTTIAERRTSDPSWRTRRSEKSKEKWRDSNYREFVTKRMAEGKAAKKISEKKRDF
jgi:hypothetical protein